MGSKRTLYISVSVTAHLVLGGGLQSTENQHSAWNDAVAAFAASVKNREESSIDNKQRHPSGPAGMMLGIGLGGFFDGILLHQIFQAHAMLSAKVPLDSMENMKTNMTADGLFHAAT